MEENKDITFIVPPLQLGPSSTIMDTNPEVVWGEHPSNESSTLFEGFEEFEQTPLTRKCYTLTPNLDEPVEGARQLSIFDTSDMDMSKILGPDHPLLQRFQKSLTSQLSLRIHSLKKEVADLEDECRIQTECKESIGVEAYDTQQMSNKLQGTTEEVLNELYTLVQAQSELVFQVDSTQKEMDAEKDSFHNTEKEEIEIRNELEAMDVLINEMQHWEEALENEMLVNQRMLDNSEKFKKEMNIRKKQQDLLIFEFMNEVWKLEAELETSQMQLRVKEEDREKLAEATAMATIDIEASQTELKSLVHGWQSVLATINHRDKYHNQLQEQFRKYDDKMSGVNCELIHLRKRIQREHGENERLTLLKERLDNDSKGMLSTYAEEEDKQTDNMKVASQYGSIISENEDKRMELVEQIEQIKAQEQELDQETEVLNLAKYKMEQKIVASLQGNTFSTDNCRQMANVLKDIEEENRKSSINIARMERQISNKHAELQTKRIELDDLGRMMESLKVTITAEEAVFMEINREFTICDKALTKLITHYESLKQKSAGETLQKMQVWPQEVRIRQLEANISDMQDRNKHLQSFWLREQGIIVDLTEKRQVQLRDIDMLKKQILIMDQKNLRINDKIHEQRMREEDIRKSITWLENRMYVCTSWLQKKRDTKHCFDIANDKIENKLMGKLEESEYNSLKIKAEITEVEDDKLLLSRELLERNREAMVWEKKLTIIGEIRRQMQTTQGNTGDIPSMKAEIHRMNVRYTHLKRAQDKLIQDLDNCVIRRDSIVTLAECRSRSYKGGLQQWRINFNKRREELRTKMSHAKGEFEELSKRNEAKHKDIDALETHIKSVESEFGPFAERKVVLISSLRESQIERQLKLDILLFKQQKMKTYYELAQGKPPYVRFKSSLQAHKAYIYECELNAKLRLIIDGLLNEMPDHNHFLTKLHNSVTLPVLCL